MSAPRILSLLPSTTEIVGALGLQDALVGVTHECDVCPDPDGLEAALGRGVQRVTRSHIDPHTLEQGDIHAAVQRSLLQGGSLYDLREELLPAMRPTVVLTQALCAVCAPDYGEVAAACKRLGAALADSDGVEPTVLSLEPGDLRGVGETFRQIAELCGVPERGVALEAQFHERLNAVRVAAQRTEAPPRVLLLEWLDPPFDGGHWVPGQLLAAGTTPASNVDGGKSRALSWDEVEAAGPDVIVVACCGFDLARNRRDTEQLLGADTAVGARFRALRAVRAGRLYALDGNRYFARPAPSLAVGAAILARCAHDGDDAVCRRLDALGFLPPEGQAWQRVGAQATAAPAEEPRGDAWALHEAACQEGRLSYADPVTGFRVFTRVGLLARGRCCGCGCRHCPFAHENVADKAARIQQPAYLHRASNPGGGPAAVLFWSGGKDSFLTLRALRREAPDERVVLLSTFDAATRVVAHQEVPISALVRQAQALDLDLVGVPLHTSSAYVERLTAGLAVLQRDSATAGRLVFGDLHLEHIRDWREDALAPLGLPRSYPLWRRHYDALLADLLASQVPCEVTASGYPEVIPVGAVFDAALVQAAVAAGLDAFGENGEFHTLARVWDAPVDVRPSQAG